VLTMVIKEEQGVTLWSSRQRYFARVLLTKSGRQSIEGYAQGSNLSVDRCASYELDGDARHDKVFIQVRPS
jgi:hypothetical protein